MKKIILGILIGVSITAAGSAYADDIKNVIGLKVEGSFPVKVNGVKTTNDAVIIDGSSYLPVRAMGEALNMDVKFDADLGIELKEKGVTKVETTPQPQATSIPAVPEKTTQQKIDELRSKIIDDKNTLETHNNLMKINEDSLKNSNVPKESVQKAIDGYKKIITEIEARISSYEAEITALQNK
ncbi:hypothetical protein [Paenibacillus alba]|uniref:Copper amine oxidase-like N-terminal domain-containing protein n=1 Tax=Paenibacillus alba TaxID=1197127 RepID=A0ABU6GAG8_9BACL|nr:hypothetical protein [Paenibacillus alba]MEC0231184.1 hypothetical protein [Paenibacillus alba]